MTYHGHYKVLTNTKTGQVHVLHQCGVAAPTEEELPAHAAGGTFVQVPISASATTSTTYMPFLEMIGERSTFKAYGSDFGYVSSPCLRKMYRDGDVVSAYDSSTWSVDNEVLASLDVAVTFADAWSLSAHNAYEMTDIAEEGPNSVLKTAEYVEVVGLFFNREAEATFAIETMIANYLCAKEKVAALLGVDSRASDVEVDAVKVCWTSYYAYASDDSGGWTMAASGAWYHELIDAAGADLIVPADVDVVGAVVSSWGAAYMSTAQVLDVCADADVIISPDIWAEGTAPFTDLDALKAVANGRVFDNQGARGFAAWFESRVVEPDVVLQDLAIAFYPDSGAFGALPRAYLRSTSNGEAPVYRVDDADLDLACPDINAPYVFEAASLCASSSSKKNDTKPVVLVAVVVAVAVLVALLGVAACACKASRPTKTPKVLEDGQAKANAEAPSL